MFALLRFLSWVRYAPTDWTFQGAQMLDPIAEATVVPIGFEPSTGGPGQGLILRRECEGRRPP